MNNVADVNNSLPFDMLEPFNDCHCVEQCLRRMFALSVACVDPGNLACAQNIGHTFVTAMATNNEIRFHREQVRQRFMMTFTLLNACGVICGENDKFHAQTMSCNFKTCSSSCRRFEKGQ